MPCNLHKPEASLHTPFELLYHETIQQHYLLHILSKHLYSSPSCSFYSICCQSEAGLNFLLVRFSLGEDLVDLLVLPFSFVVFKFLEF